MLVRSVWLPLKAIVMNTLSRHGRGGLGALVWVFQDGNLSRLLRLPPLGYVETTLPVILFCVLFGLSMDYEVFLLSPMKEASMTEPATIRGQWPRVCRAGGQIIISAATHRGAGGRVVRIRRHRADQGARARRRAGGGRRRHDRARTAGAGDHVRLLGDWNW